MALAVGIVGLPNVGKSTLFNALSNAGAQSANYPFCTIDPNVGMVAVPDERMDALVKTVDPLKVVPTTVEFVDIAGLVKGASQGEGLGNQFLTHIRNVDAIVHVVRCFEDENIIHVNNKVDPVGDAEVINTELLLRDIQAVDARLAKAKKNSKGGDKAEKQATTTCEKLLDAMGRGTAVRNIALDEADREVVQALTLLTAKPALYAANVAEAQLSAGLTDPRVAALHELARLCKKSGGEVAQRLSEIGHAFRPDIAIHFGLAQSCSGFRLERVARNRLCQTGQEPRPA